MSILIVFWPVLSSHLPPNVISTLLGWKKTLVRSLGEDLPRGQVKISNLTMYISYSYSLFCKQGKWNFPSLPPSLDWPAKDRFVLHDGYLSLGGFYNTTPKRLFSTMTKPELTSYLNYNKSYLLLFSLPSDLSIDSCSVCHTPWTKITLFTGKERNTWRRETNAATATKIYI